jgi:thymidine kinase
MSSAILECREDRGYCSVIVGPMFSGKSTELLRVRRLFIVKRKKVLCINYVKDMRYSETGAITPHEPRISTVVPAFGVSSLFEIEAREIASYDAILIDEGQFFPDLTEFCEYCTGVLGKKVMVAALSSTYEREPFPSVSELISRADDVQFRTSICATCCGRAPFTWRKTNSKELVIVGGAETYQPACRECYIELKRERDNELIVNYALKKQVNLSQSQIDEVEKAIIENGDGTIEVLVR